MNRRSIVAFFALTSVIIVSGCTSSPSSRIEEMKQGNDEAKEELMQQVTQQSVGLEVAAVFESEGSTVLKIMNTGRKQLSTQNLTVRTGSESFECTPEKVIAAGDTADCLTMAEYPETGETKSFRVLYSGKEEAGYNCTVTSEENVAC